MFAFLSSSKLKENLTELYIIVRTTGSYHIQYSYAAQEVHAHEVCIDGSGLLWRGLLGPRPSPDNPPQNQLCVSAAGQLARTEQGECSTQDLCSDTEYCVVFQGRDRHRAGAGQGPTPCWMTAWERARTSHNPHL